VNTVCHSTRCFTTSAVLHEKALPPRRVIDENEITESFLKGSGPGGQKINKTSSAVQLKHGPTGIVVKCQETRSREQNRKLARQILGERLDELEKGDQSRTAIKADRARTKKASAAKKSRRKYKKLEDEKEAESGDEQDEEIQSVNGSPSITAAVTNQPDVASGKDESVKL
jgi:peptide chain release factor